MLKAKFHFSQSLFETPPFHFAFFPRRSGNRSRSSLGPAGQPARSPRFSTGTGIGQSATRGDSRHAQRLFQHSVGIGCLRVDERFFDDRRRFQIGRRAVRHFATFQIVFHGGHDGWHRRFRSRAGPQFQQRDLLRQGSADANRNGFPFPRRCGFLAGRNANPAIRFFLRFSVFNYGF